VSLAEQSAPSRSRRPWTHILVFLAPAALIYTLFSIYPLLDTIRYALYTQDETGVAHFAGLKNFIDLLTHPVWADQFRNALVNNLIFFAIHVTVQNIIGIALAAMLSLPRLFGRNVYRTLIFLPTMLSVVIIGFIWQLILSPLWGVSEGFLKTIGLPQLFAPWLGQESTALITVSLI
jgi:raffinose/stachyose/melibiose transport system permease protein